MDSSNDKIQEALEAHGRSRGIDEVSKFIAHLMIIADGYDFKN